MSHFRFTKSGYKFLLLNPTALPRGSQNVSQQVCAREMPPPDGAIGQALPVYRTRVLPDSFSFVFQRRAVDAGFNRPPQAAAEKQKVDVVSVLAIDMALRWSLKR